MENYQTAKADFIASKLSGICATTIYQTTLVHHEVSVSCNGKPAGKLIIPQEFGCAKKAFSIPIDNITKNDSDSIFKYTISYIAKTMEGGGICSWTLTERKNLGDYL